MGKCCAKSPVFAQYTRDTSWDFSYKKNANNKEDLLSHFLLFFDCLHPGYTGAG